MSSLRLHIRNGTVRFTRKAAHEFIALGLDEPSALEVLLALSTVDLVCRIVSPGSGEHLYVFKPVVNDVLVYIKVAFRQACVVISFHEDDGDFDEE